MKRPTANVSGDNPDSAPVAGEERDQTLFTSALLPHVSSRTGSSNTVTGQRTSSGNY